MYVQQNVIGLVGYHISLRMEAPLQGAYTGVAFYHRPIRKFTYQNTPHPVLVVTSFEIEKKCFFFNMRKFIT